VHRRKINIFRFSLSGAAAVEKARRRECLGCFPAKWPRAVSSSIFHRISHVCWHSSPAGERESTVCTQKSVAAGKVGPEQRRAFRGVHRRRRALFANRSRRRTLSEQEREKSHSWHSICFLRVEFIDCLSQIEFQDRKLYHEKVLQNRHLKQKNNAWVYFSQIIYKLG
jgi:hypothetical protein